MSIYSSSRHPSPMVLEHTTTEHLTPTQDQVAAAVPRSAAGCQRINAVRGRLKEIWADEHARDGALGFWKAVGEVWSKVREQRCWVHKTANVLNKLPKSVQPKAKTGRWSMPTDHWRHGRRVRRGPRRNRPLKRLLGAGLGSAPRDSSSGAH
jgi:hypothetical protein